MKKILLILGTRPEAIKFAPLYHALADDPGFQPSICHTGQQPEMADGILSFFGIRPEIRLNLNRQTFSLTEFTKECLAGIGAVLEDARPDLVFVQGDTSTTFCGALAAYYQKIPVAHLEAGLRTGNKYAPFPEEMNRKMTTALADLHLAPTQGARAALLGENVSPAAIHVVGNSVIDALLGASGMIDRDLPLKMRIEEDLKVFGLPADLNGKTVLVTGHRRENFGEGFERICQSIRALAAAHPDLSFIYPVHLNPNVQKPVHAILGGLPNVYLIPPVNYPHFIYLMKTAKLILTDSGGVQEEAPSLGKPVLVMRENTDRPESIEAGCAKLVGTTGIIEAAQALLTDRSAYDAMARVQNPYGDGRTVERIVGILKAGIVSGLAA